MDGEGVGFAGCILWGGVCGIGFCEGGFVGLGEGVG